MNVKEPAAVPPAWKAWAGWGVKLLATALILYFVLRKVPLEGIAAALRKVDRPMAALSVLVFLAGVLIVEPFRLLAAGRLLDEPPLGFRQWLRLYTESRPFFYVLPAAAGSEGMLWVRLRTSGWRHASCAFAVLFIRIWGVGIWALAAAFALQHSEAARSLLRSAPAWVAEARTWLAGGLLALAAAWASPVLLRRFKGLPARRGGLLPMLHQAMGSLASALVVSFAVVLASRAAGTPFSFAACLGFMAIFNFAMVLPISLGGFGVQEAIALAMGFALGFPPSALLVFSSLVHLQRLMLAALGLAVFLSRPSAAGQEGGRT